MQRNKLIYALADTSLVVSSDVNKGGTWAGAVEQLDKLRFVPVFVRSTGESSAGLDALKNKGALPWPNPRDADSFEEVFNVPTPSAATSSQAGFSLFDGPYAVDTSPMAPDVRDMVPVFKVENEPSVPAVVDSDTRPSVVMSEGLPPAISNAETPPGETTEKPQPEMAPAELLFSAVRASIQKLLASPMKDTEVATALDVSIAQAKAWLQRLVEEDVLEKQKKPAGYIVKQKRLFE